MSVRPPRAIALDREQSEPSEKDGAISVSPATIMDVVKGCRVVEDEQTQEARVQSVSGSIDASTGPSIRIDERTGV